MRWVVPSVAMTPSTDHQGASAGRARKSTSGLLQLEVRRQRPARRAAALPKRGSASASRSALPADDAGHSDQQDPQALTIRPCLPPRSAPPFEASSGAILDDKPEARYEERQGEESPQPAVRQKAAPGEGPDRAAGRDGRQPPGQRGGEFVPEAVGAEQGRRESIRL